MFNTKCGCRFCKHQSIPTSKVGWKTLTNKNGHRFGTNGKPNKRVKSNKAH